MIIITKENITEYLNNHMADFHPEHITRISKVGEGNSEEDGDGYVNFIFRVHTTDGNYVLKQGLERARISDTPMDTGRTKLEYDCMRIFHTVAPEYVPAVYFYDAENNLFVTDDVSYLNISRFQFNKSIVFPHFGELCGDALAKMQFFTSEYYLERSIYRRLQECFENTQMRKIMEDGMFLDRFYESYDTSLGKTFEEFAEKMTTDERYITELYKLRRKYMSHADALIHADYHTSNIFAGKDEIKVIDFEFSFMGPFAYDLGYLTGNLISQYCAACFKPFDSEPERIAYKAYLLATIKTLFETYFKKFTEYWNRSAKPRYKGQDGLRQSIYDEILIDAPGYASMVNWFRSASAIDYPDFDVITDIAMRRKATTMSLIIDWEIMFARYTFTSVDDLIDAILTVENKFFNA